MLKYLCQDFYLLPPFPLSPHTPVSFFLSVKLLLSPQTSISQAELNKTLIPGWASGRGGSKWKTFLLLDVIAKQEFAIPSARTCPDLDFCRKANFHLILWIGCRSSGEVSPCHTPIFPPFVSPSLQDRTTTEGD